MLKSFKSVNKKYKTKTLASYKKSEKSDKNQTKVKQKEN
jgi:hypothetical protein